eukprot:19472-Pyramimonas_sp.AAC.1
MAQSLPQDALDILEGLQQGQRVLGLLTKSASVQSPRRAAGSGRRLEGVWKTLEPRAADFVRGLNRLPTRSQMLDQWSRTIQCVMNSVLAQQGIQGVRAVGFERIAARARIKGPAPRSEHVQRAPDGRVEAFEMLDKTASGFFGLEELRITNGT